MGTTLSLSVSVNGDQRTYSLPIDGIREFALAERPRTLSYHARTILGEQLQLDNVANTIPEAAIGEVVFSLPPDYFVLRVKNQSHDTIRQIELNFPVPGGKSMMPVQIPPDGRTYDVGVFKKQTGKTTVDLMFIGRKGHSRYKLSTVIRHPLGYDYAVISVPGGK